MFGKAVLLLVLAAIAVQSYALKDVTENADTDVGHLIDKLKELIEEASTTAKKALNILHIFLESHYNATYELARAKILEQLKDLTDKITELKKEAINLNIDTKECMGEDEIHIEKFHKAVEACKGDILNQPEALEKKVKNFEELSGAIITRLTEEHAACGSDTEGTKCKSKVVLEIARAMTEVPMMIRQTADGPVISILGSLGTAEQCVTDAADAFIPEERDIATSVESCLRNKIHPSK